MKLTKNKLGEYIVKLDNRNNNLKYGAMDVRGINNLKKMIKTKADMSDRKFDKFYIVYPDNLFLIIVLPDLEVNFVLHITMRIDHIYLQMTMLYSI